MKREAGAAKGKILMENSLPVICLASIGKMCILKENGRCNQQINAIMNLDKKI